MPQERAVLSIALDSIASLPGGAEFSERSGRASVKASVERSGGSEVLVIEASCDSLSRLCCYWEDRAAYYRKAFERRKNDVRTEEGHGCYGVWTIVIALTAGLASGILLTILTRRIWQKVYWTEPT